MLTVTVDPKAIEAIGEELAKIAREWSPDAVRERQVYSKGYVAAMYRAGLIEAVDERTAQRALSHRVDARLTELEEQAASCPRYE